MSNDKLNLEDILVDKPSEGNLVEVPLTKRVFKAFFFFCAVVAIIVFVRFLDIGVDDHSTYTKTASANMVQTDFKRAPRGIINDRSGDPLLSNVQDFKVFLSPVDFPKDTQERNEVIEKIADILNKDKSELQNKIKNHDWTLGRPLIDDHVSHENLVSLNSEDIPGVDIEPGFKRVHSRAFIYSHLLGYVGLVSSKDIESRPELSLESEVGKDGLEMQYDMSLRGEPGEVVTYVNATGEVKEEQVVREAKTGKDLNTFIDKELQDYFYWRLRSQLDSINRTGGVGLAVNPQNGEVLSLVSLPSLNNENVGQSLERSDEPLFNRAVSGRYNPGSTIKPLVALAALEEGVVTPEDRFYSPGYLRVENPYFPDKPSIFEDWDEHGWVDMREAIARSSNVYFYLLGGGHERDTLYGLSSDMEGLGVESLKKWWKKFKIGSATDIDLPDENTGVLPDPEWKEDHLNTDWRVGDTYNVSIGQGDLRVTPTGLISYISTIANGGKVYKLRVAGEDDPQLISDISGDISESNLNVVREGMVHTSEKPYGTAYMLSDLPMEVASKTGSAQVGRGDVNAFFVGYAPSQNPEIAILVLIEDATEGSLNAVPVARDVLMWYYNNRIKNHN